MSTSKRDLSSELFNRLSSSEYQKAGEYLKEACYYSDKARDENTYDYDDRIRNFLICAFEVYKNAGMEHATIVMKEYMKFF